MDNQNINASLARHFSGETTPYEESIVLTWIKDNKEEYISLKVFFAENQQLDQPQLFSVDMAWKNIVPNLLPAKPTVFQLYRRYGYAASVAILILLATLVFFYNNSEIIIKTADAQVKNIKLSDGSLVTLNEHSSISYKNSFWARRTVRLNGEAFFKVKHDANRPFTVNTDSMTVNVLGTSFVVQTTAKKKLVAVIKGKVSVSSSTVKQTVILEKKQAVYLSANKFIKQNYDDKNLLSWKTKQLSFKNAPLQKVFEDLEKCYHIKIRVIGNIPESCTITTNFEKESMKEVLEEFHLLFGLNYIQKNNVIYVKDISCY